MLLTACCTATCAAERNSANNAHSTAQMGADSNWLRGRHTANKPRKRLYGHVWPAVGRMAINGAWRTAPASESRRPLPLPRRLLCTEEGILGGSWHAFDLRTSFQILGVAAPAFAIGAGCGIRADNKKLLIGR